jgi:ribosomal protein L11 methyltransferase
MAWVSVAIDVQQERADAVADALLELGALSVDVSDAQAGTSDERAIFDEPDEPAHTHWSRNRICALFDRKADYRCLVRAACEAAGLRALPAMHAEPLAEQDWVRASQQQFSPTQISERLWIVPTWSEPPAPGAINLRLDPGLAFGTGSHPTTWQCLQWLDQNLRGGETVLDYGCGSGVLAIAAKRLGAGRVIGVDVDPNALCASRENAELNRVSAQFVAPDQLPEASFDVVLANILANPLRVLAPLLAARTRPHGRIVLAGILLAQADAVRLSYAPWFELTGSVLREGWICMSGARRF